MSFYLFRCIKCYHVDIHWLTPFQQQPQSDEAPAVKLLLRPLSAHSICLKKKYIYVSVYVLFPSQNSKIQCFQGSTLLSGIKINNLNESHINHQGDDAWREKGKKLHRFFLNLSCIKVETLWPFFFKWNHKKAKDNRIKHLTYCWRLHHAEIFGKMWRATQNYWKAIPNQLFTKARLAAFLFSSREIPTMWLLRARKRQFLLDQENALKGFQNRNLRSPSRGKWFSLSESCGENFNIQATTVFFII